jgi:hypothetical protein
LFAGAKDSILKLLETGGSAGSFRLDDIPDSYVTAFRHGLEVSLVVAVVLIVLAGVASAVVSEPPPVDDDELASDVGVRVS